MTRIHRDASGSPFGATRADERTREAPELLLERILRGGQALRNVRGSCEARLPAPPEKLPQRF